MKPSDAWASFLNASLENLEKANRRRTKRTTQYLGGQLIVRESLRLINFGGNDYLGLRNHPTVVNAAMQALESDGVGSGASPAVTGYSTAQMQLEERLASFNKMPAALVFSSGFAGNLATISSLVVSGDVVFSDALNHASLIDGCRLSKAHREVYPHNDTQWLNQRMKEVRHRFQRAIIVTESIFSMDGDAAPLVELAGLAEQYDCGLVVDEAHATGVYGSSGAGLVDELGLTDRVLAKLGTLSKAIGCHGGFVCGSSALIEHVLNFGRSYMFSTALPSSVLAAANIAVQLICQMSAQRIALRSTASMLRTQLLDCGWQLLGADSPILPIVLGAEVAALGLSQELQTAGFFVPAIRPPTVPAGTSRLRISLSFEHSQSQLDSLRTALSHLPSAIRVTK